MRRYFVGDMRIRAFLIATLATPHETATEGQPRRAAQDVRPRILHWKGSRMQVLERPDLPHGRPGSSVPPMTMPQAGAPAQPQPPGPAQLIDALLHIHRQDRFAGALAAATASAAKLGNPSFIGCLLRDPGTGGWHVTALFDPAGRPVQLAQSGLPMHPFAFTPPPQVVARPLTETFGEGWGAERCAMVERALGVRTVLCAPLRDTAGLRGALIAFPTSGAHLLLVAGVLVHAATAAVRLLGREYTAISDGVLDAATFAERGAHELARAVRYNRQVTLVVFETNNLPELAQMGPALVRTLRKWDILGRVEAERPVLAAVLPETGPNGGLGLIRRLRTFLENVEVGAASFPEDGNKLDMLIDAARARVARPTNLPEVPPQPPSAEKQPKKARAGAEITTTWMRGMGGPGIDTVRCPRCMASYMRTGAPLGNPLLVEQAIITTRTFLHGQCPNHPPRFTMTF